jgi:hypothetical protein
MFNDTLLLLWMVTKLERLTCTPSDHIVLPPITFISKKTSNFGHYHNQKLTTFKLINTIIPNIPLFNFTFFYAFTSLLQKHVISKVNKNGNIVNLTMFYTKSRKLTALN